MNQSAVRCACVSLGLFLAVVVSLNRASAAEPPHYYYCESSNTYFPYAQTCLAPWKEIEAKPIAPASAPVPVPQPAVIMASASPAPAPVPMPTEAEPSRHGVIAYPKGMPAPIQAAVTSAPAPAPAFYPTVAAPAEPASKGPITFVFGAETPTIVCAVAQLCDVALQPGEKVNQIVIGDPERWKVDQANEGSGPGETAHLIIRPLSPDIDSSMIVFTKTRTYHLQLRSHRRDYMLQVAFSYPGAEVPAMAKAEDNEDGLVKVGPVTYVKGREPKGWVGHGSITPAEPAPAVPRPEVTRVKPQTP